MSVPKPRRDSSPQVHQAWRAYLEALQETQGRRTAEVRRAEDRFRDQAQQYGQLSVDAGNPGGAPETTAQAVTGRGGGDQAALEKLFAEAERWLGLKERGKDGNPFSAYFKRPAEAWCADFVSYLHEIAGMPLGQKGVGFAGCTEMAQWFKEQNAFHNGTPQPGDAIFFDFKAGDRDYETHVGIVVKVENGRVYTIEGNVGNTGGGAGGGVARRDYALGDSRITGYGSRLRLGNLGQGEAPLDRAGATIAGPAASGGGASGGGSSGGGGGVGGVGRGGGSSSGGGASAVSPPTPSGRSSGELQSDPARASPPLDSGDFFTKLIGALMELTDEQRRVLSKALGKSSEFAKYGQQRMGAGFDPKNPPAWLVLEFAEKKLGALADTPEGEAMLAKFANLDGEALVGAVSELLQMLDASDPTTTVAPAKEDSPQGPLPSLQDLTGEPTPPTQT